ncbi:MAG: LCP family protein, partial [Ruminococcus sp.]|nr:LCP family protein [Ruminococcus sp.]
MTGKFQNEENTDNENTMRIPIPPNPQKYRKPNTNRQSPQKRLNNQRPRQNSQPQNTGYQHYNSSQNYRRQSPPDYQNRNYQPYNPDYQNYQQYSQNYQNPNYQQYNQNYQNTGYQQYNAGYQNPNYQRPDYPPQRQSYSSPPRRKKKKRKHRSIGGRIIRKIVLTLFTILILLFVVYSCTALTVIGKVGKEETGDRNRTDSAMSRSYVKSVLIIGTDGRSADEPGRSDSMILLSFNSHTNKIILTSFMRDCYVNIQGYGMDKLNAAYSYGGASLLMDTIESNFMVEIDDYITVNFVSFAGIIDAVGGIDIDVSDEEAHEINNI